jgi:CRISPR-associated protein Csx10
MNESLPTRLHIKMLSDWHIGTGTGRHGGIDRLVARDAQGLPYIPASTLRSIWRDAAERLAIGLDGGKPDGPWQSLVRHLFGSQPTTEEADGLPPVKSRIFVGDARLTDGIAAFAKHRDIRDALTFIKSGVGIDPATGAAMDDFLRFEEVAVAGLTLSAPVTLDASAKDAETVRCFLIGSACLIESMGAKRRRGLGNCEVRFLGNGQTTQFEALRVEAAKGLRKQTQAPKIADTALIAVSPEARQGIETWQQIPIEILLQSPLVVADDVQGNVITTQDFIPGSYLLPIISAAARSAKLDKVNERIAAGNLRVLPATIDVDGGRGLPIPLSWSTLKDDSLDASFEILNVLTEKPDRAKQLKTIRKGYVSATLPDKAAWRPSLKTALRTHNVIDDEHQTPTEDIGGVFSYEALEPGQMFRSVVLLRGSAEEKGAFERELRNNPSIRLGRAKQAGYGAATLTVAGPKRCSECSLPTDDLFVWLETDAVLPGDDLASSVGIATLASSIAAAVDSNRKMEDIFDLRCSGASLRVRRVQSWQAAWGLPRPSLTVLQAGSVARLKLKAGTAISKEALSKLATDGIGERRAEGFGMVRLNDPLVNSAAAIEVTKTSPQPDWALAPNPHPNPKDESITKSALSERAWKRRILARAEAVMSNSKKRNKHLDFDESGGFPRMSQLGALRSLLPHLENNPSNRVVKWVGHQEMKLKGKDAGWLGRIKAVATPGIEIWSILELGGDTLPPPPAPDKTPNAMRTQLWTFAVENTLLVAMHHHKRAKENQDKDRKTNVAPVQPAGAPT